jgi:LDH2 family malate/lactate/ureidoglycolate dehydrogenase
MTMSPSLQSNTVFDQTHRKTATVSVMWLMDCLQKIFQAYGLPPEHARQVSDVLVQADMRGIYSHGSSRITIYTERLKRGLFNPIPNINVVATGPGTLVIDGDNGMGAVVGYHTVNALLPFARETGLAAATVHHSNHFGIAAVYAEALVKAGCFALVCSNAPPTMAPHGSNEAVFGTNPIALGIPISPQNQLVTDMATSMVARGKIIRAVHEGASIPSDWALDASGQRTTNPSDALNGVVLPFAGPKGSAIALFVDLLAGVLSGANYAKQTPDLYRNLTDRSNIGHFMLAIDIKRFQAWDSYYERIKDCLSMVSESTPQSGTEMVKLPGQIESENKRQALTTGIPLPPDVMLAIEKACAQAGVAFEAPAA